MTVRPVVDGIERQFSGRLDVVRLDIQDPVGSELAEVYGANYTPTFVLFDPQGREVWRSVFRIDQATVGQFLAP